MPVLTDEIRELSESGLNLVQIALRLGLSYSKVRYWSKPGYFRDHCRKSREAPGQSAKRAEATRQWRRDNPGWESERKRRDPQFRLAKNLRIRLLQAVKGKQKAGSAVDDLGCSIEELKHWLEWQFQSGMSWENHGEWHIDHIKPLSKFDLQDRDQFLEACHYSNLQPLWAKDNLVKGAS